MRHFQRWRSILSHVVAEATAYNQNGGWNVEINFTSAVWTALWQLLALTSNFSSAARFWSPYLYTVTLSTRSSLFFRLLAKLKSFKLKNVFFPVHFNWLFAAATSPFLFIAGSFIAFAVYFRLFVYLTRNKLQQTGYVLVVLASNKMNIYSEQQQQHATILSRVAVMLAVEA